MKYNLSFLKIVCFKGVTWCNNITLKYTSFELMDIDLWFDVSVVNGVSSKLLISKYMEHDITLL